MRPLEESEIQQVFEKLFKFVGKNLKNIVDRADQPHCFRLHKKVRRDSVRPPRRRSAPFFLSLGGKVPSSVLLSCNPVSAMMKEISALLIPREVQTILMVEFLRLSRTAQPWSTALSLASPPTAPDCGRSLTLPAPTALCQTASVLRERGHHEARDEHLEGSTRIPRRVRREIHPLR